MEKFEHITRVSIPDEDMKQWIDTLREGGFSEEEVDSMMINLNETYWNIKGPDMVEREIKRLKEVLVQKHKFYMNKEQEDSLRASLQKDGIEGEELSRSYNMEFYYTTITTKTFDEAVNAVQEEIANVGMRVLYIHDVQKSLAEKGFPRGSFKIIEFCNAKYAYEFLNKDINIGLCMPCKINVYTEDEKTLISAMRPVVLSQFFPHAGLGEMPKEVDQVIKGIIDNVT